MQFIGIALVLAVEQAASGQTSLTFVPTAY
jgi:hypothetical protein